MTDEKPKRGGSRGGGRPPGATHTASLHIRVPPEELATAQRLAAEHGMTFSEWVRRRVTTTEP